MDNGQVTKPITGTERLDSNLSSDAEEMEGAVEFRLLMAYATRRRSKKEANAESKNGLAVTNHDTDTDQKPSQTPQKTEELEIQRKNRRKKTIWRRLKPILTCVRPQTDDKEPTPSPAEDPAGPDFRCLQDDEHHDSGKDEDELEEVAARMIKFADEIQFTEVGKPSDVETDSQDDLEHMIGLLLRNHGDRLNEEFNLSHIAAELFFDYNFFTRLLDTFLVRIGFRSPSSDSLRPQAAQKTQVAATFEITSRLTTVKALPSTVLLKHGTRYLKENFSQWAEKQGGLVAVFQNDDEEVD